MLHESLLDAFTTDEGIIDLKTKKGGLSVAKQVKAMVQAMRKEAELRCSTIFKHMELAEIAGKLFKSIPIDLQLIIDVMRSECYIIMKGNRTYQLQV